MLKGLTYFWLIMFACSLNSTFAMNPNFQNKTHASKSIEISCCCDHSGDANCSKQCCIEGKSEKSSDENDCQGQCGSTGNQIPSISITTCALPNEQLVVISGFIDYTFEVPNFSYLESIPQPIASPIWQPPKLG